MKNISGVHAFISVLLIWLCFGIFLLGAMVWEYTWKKNVEKGRLAYNKKLAELSNAPCFKPFSLATRGSQGDCFGVLIPEDEMPLKPGSKVMMTLTKNHLVVDLPFTVKHCETTIRVGGAEGVKRLPSVYVFVQEKVGDGVSILA